MKTQFKRFSKSTISVLLAVCLLFSCMTVGLIATSAAQDDSAKLGAVDNSESIGSNTSDGTALLFFNMSAVNWWIADSGNQNFAYFYNNTTNKNAWSAHSVQQTGNYYYVVVPSGTWEGVILTRNNTTTSPSWENKWNQTGDITWTSGKNYISAFSENSKTATLGTYQVTSTASLAATKTSMTTADSSTLTPSLSSNTDYNVIKSTSSAVTYNAKGFTGITKTATATKQITVTQAATNYTVTFGTVTGYANGTATATVTSGSQVTSGTSVTFTATPTNSNYQFVGWYGNASGTGSVVSSNASYTTTINATTSLYAKFVPVVQITAGTVSNGSLSIAYKKPDGTDGTLTSGSAYILSGSNVTVTATASTGYYVQKIGTSNVSGTYPSTGSKTYSNVTILM